jgi:hypothetical protein
MLSPWNEWQGQDPAKYQMLKRDPHSNRQHLEGSITPLNAVDYVGSNRFLRARRIYYLKLRNPSAQGEVVPPHKLQQFRLALTPAFVHHLARRIQQQY